MCLYSANAGINSGEICNLNFVETSSSGEEGEHTKCVQHIVGISKSIFLFRFHCLSLFTDPFQQIFVFFTESNSWRVTENSQIHLSTLLLLGRWSTIRWLHWPVLYWAQLLLHALICGTFSDG